MEDESVRRGSVAALCGVLLASLLTYPLLFFVFALSAEGDSTGTTLFIFVGPAVGWIMVAGLIVRQWAKGELLRPPPAAKYCVACGTGFSDGATICSSCGAARRGG